jgi:GNAT superfamily N-acetyltransferase
MIELTEEPYDGPIAHALVAALHAELVDRYAEATATWSQEEVAADDVAYFAEITPALVAPPTGAFLVAWVDGEAVGCGALKPLDGSAEVGEIKRMYTASNARRLGVGRTILDRLEAAAAELGYRRLQLETGVAQPEAVAMYEARGWHRIEGYGRYKDLVDSVCFAKDVRAA